MADTKASQGAAQVATKVAEQVAIQTATQKAGQIEAKEAVLEAIKVLSTQVGAIDAKVESNGKASEQRSEDLAVQLKDFKTEVNSKFDTVNATIRHWSDATTANSEMIVTNCRVLADHAKLLTENAKDTATVRDQSMDMRRSVGDVAIAQVHTTTSIQALTNEMSDVKKNSSALVKETEGQTTELAGQTRTLTKIAGSKNIDRLLMIGAFLAAAGTMILNHCNHVPDSVFGDCPNQADEQNLIRFASPPQGALEK